MNLDETLYGLVVNTNKYAGNFEREMCAYMTGQIGECGVGDEEAEEFNESDVDAEIREELENIITQRADDHGCYRPVEIFNDTEMDKERYNSFIIHLEEKPSDEALVVMLDRAREYGERVGASVNMIRVVKIKTEFEYINSIK